MFLVAESESLFTRSSDSNIDSQSAREVIRLRSLFLSQIPRKKLVKEEKKWPSREKKIVFLSTKTS